MRCNKVAGLIIIFLFVLSTVVFALTADEYYQRGIGKYLTGDFDGALQELKEALKIDPNHKKAKELLPTVLKSKREAEARREKAARKAREAAREREEKIARHQELGRAYYRKGELYKAIEEFKHVLALDPQDTLAKEYIQKTEKKIKEIEKAEAQAAENERKIVQYYALGEEHYRGGRYLEALDEWDRVLALVPKHTGVEGHLAGMKRSYLAGKLTPKVAERFIQVIAQRRSEKEAKSLTQERTRIEAQMKARKAREVKEAKIREYALKGKALYGEDKYQEAIMEFKRIVALEPEHSEAINYIARAQEAIREAERRIEAKKKEIGTHYKGGEDYYNKGRYQEALSEFQAILTINPKHAEAKGYIKKIQIAMVQKERGQEEKERKIATHYRLGETYYKGARYQEALSEFKAILTLEPKHREASKYLVKTEEAIKERKEAQREVVRRKIQEKRAREIASHYGLGETYYKAEQYRDAMEEFKKILTIDPEHKGAAKYIERAQESLKRSEEERLLAEKKAKEKERERKISRHYNSGAEYYKEDDLIGASEEFKKILDLDPEHKGAKKYLACIRDKLRKAITEAGSYYTRGIAYYERGEYKKAISQWEKVLTLDPTHERAGQYIKKAQEKLREIVKAEKALERKAKARERERKIAEYYRRGYNLYRAGDLKGAATEFRRVIRLAPRHKKAREYLTKAQEELRYRERKVPKEEVTPPRRMIPEEIGTPSRRGPVDEAEVARLYNQGLIEYGDGHIARAIEKWEQVLKLDPNHVKALKNIIRAKEELRKQR